MRTLVLGGGALLKYSLVTISFTPVLSSWLQTPMGPGGLPLPHAQMPRWDRSSAGGRATLEAAPTAVCLPKVMPGILERAGEGQAKSSVSLNLWAEGAHVALCVCVHCVRARSLDMSGHSGHSQRVSF